MRRKISLLLGSSILSLSMGCSVEQGSQVKDSGFDPKPETDELTLMDQAKRFRGQKDFTNIQYSSPVRSMAESASAGGDARNKTGTAQRAVQESDVFKVGTEGSKLLYLLNSARGLQVVSFRNGPQNPEILGRVAPTGNYSERMYYLEEANRIVVLENNYLDENGSYQYSRNQSRIVVYDVSDETAPAITRTIDLEGQVADSRVVGDVLYIAGSVRPNYYERQGNQKPKGLVYSIKFGEEGVQANSLNKVDLALPSSSRENMNIVEVPMKDGTFKYYLLAVLSESGWGWWDARSLVEVIDITDPNGKIDPLMVVSAKGNIRERSQAFIKDENLVVVSNYQLPRTTTGNRRIARIAVETFKLQNDKSEVISEDEAEYRRLHIDRQLKGLEGEKLDDAKAKLLADKELGLQGRFVQVDGKMRKVVSDSVVTVGDTNGMSASLQDVRINNDLLYVFWVPANNIDPLDLFDLSDLDNGVKYIRRLTFDGWISRAEPVTYKGREFVVGLGWVIPNVDNERWRRQPQAMLFEIIEHNGQKRALDVAQFTMDMERGFANFNRGDKYVDFRVGADGQGSIMFQITGKVNGKWKNGGKLIGIDIEAALNGRSEETFSESGFLVSENATWLKRVFRNSEIEKINTFSNQELATFEDDVRASSADQVFDAISVLELARDMKAYASLAKGGAGVQFVSQGNYWSRGKSKTELRLVGKGQEDAEKANVAHTIVIDGHFTSKMKINENELLVATFNNKAIDTGRVYEWNGQPIFRYERENILHKIKLDNSQLVVTAKRIVENNDANLSRERTIGFSYGSYGNGLQLMRHYGRVLATFGGQLFVINDRSKSLIEKITVETCEAPAKNASLSANLLNGQLVFNGKERLKYEGQGQSRGQVYFSKSYLARANINWDTNTVSCGTFVNVPGEPVSLIGNVLVSNDNRLVEMKRQEHTYTRPNGEAVTYVSFDIKQESLLSSTAIDFAAKAKLVDLYDGSSLNMYNLKTLANGTIVYLKSEDQGSGFIPPFRRGMDLRIGGMPRPSIVSSTMAFLGVDDEGYFTSRRSSFDLGVTGSARINTILNTGSEYGEMILATVGRRIFALSVAKDGSIVNLDLKSTTINGKNAKDGNSVLLPGWVSSYSTIGMDFDATTGSLVVSQGMTGNTAIKVSK